jgi:hypothetical protein
MVPVPWGQLGQGVGQKAHAVRKAAWRTQGGGWYSEGRRAGANGVCSESEGRR